MPNMLLMLLFSLVSSLDKDFRLPSVISIAIIYCVGRLKSKCISFIN